MLIIFAIEFIFLIGICVVTPIVSTKYASPWLGVLIAIIVFWLWLRYGPPPSPGFANGILCLWGCGMIVGTFITCLVLGIQNAIANS